MQPIPDDILSPFNALLGKRSVPILLHDAYRKWLTYYLDFRVKYRLPDDRSEQVRLFMEKLRSKGQSGKSLNYAAHALSLFFSLEARSREALISAEKVVEVPTLPSGLSDADSGLGASSASQAWLQAVRT